MARKSIPCCSRVCQKKANPLNAGVHPEVDRLTHCILGLSHKHAYSNPLSVDSVFIMMMQNWNGPAVTNVIQTC